MGRRTSGVVLLALLCVSGLVATAEAVQLNAQRQKRDRLHHSLVARHAKRMRASTGVNRHLQTMARTGAFRGASKAHAFLDHALAGQVVFEGFEHAYGSGYEAPKGNADAITFSVLDTNGQVVDVTTADRVLVSEDGVDFSYSEMTAVAGDYWAPKDLNANIICNLDVASAKTAVRTAEGQRERFEKAFADMWHNPQYGKDGSLLGKHSMKALEQELRDMLDKEKKGLEAVQKENPKEAHRGSRYYEGVRPGFFGNIGGALVDAARSGRDSGWLSSAVSDGNGRALLINDDHFWTCARNTYEFGHRLAVDAAWKAGIQAFAIGLKDPHATAPAHHAPAALDSKHDSKIDTKVDAKYEHKYGDKEDAAAPAAGASASAAPPKVGASAGTAAVAAAATDAKHNAAGITAPAVESTAEKLKRKAGESAAARLLSSWTNTAAAKLMEKMKPNLWTSWGATSAAETADKLRADAELKAGGIGKVARDLRRAYAMDGFVSHFLSDQFSSGHLRTPRVELRTACDGMSDGAKEAGMSANVMHDEDNWNCLLVKNARGQVWWACGDHRFFDQENAMNRRVLHDAIEASVRGVSDAFLTGLRGLPLGEHDNDPHALDFVGDTEHLSKRQSAENTCPLYRLVPGAAGPNGPKAVQQRSGPLAAYPRPAAAVRYPWGSSLRWIRSDAAFPAWEDITAQRNNLLRQTDAEFDAAMDAGKVSAADRACSDYRAFKARSVLPGDDCCIVLGRATPDLVHEGGEYADQLAPGGVTKWPSTKFPADQNKRVTYLNKCYVSQTAEHAAGVIHAASG